MHVSIRPLAVISINGWLQLCTCRVWFIDSLKDMWGLQFNTRYERPNRKV